MNTVFIYNRSRGLILDQKDPILIQNALRDTESLVWMDLEDPTDDEIDILTDIFQFHPLSIEDCIFPQNRPKIEEFENYVFIVVHGILYDHNHDPSITTQELNIFVGHNFIVTFHENPLRNISMVKTRCREKVDILAKGSDFVLHLVLDNLVDSYFPILNQMDTVIDKIEDDIFTEPTSALLNDVFSLKRDLMAMRRVINPQREMIANLTRRDFPFIQGPTLVYFRDIHDHLVRMTDTIDTYREIMTNALDVYLSVTSNQMNSVMKTLTIITTIMMPGTLIASVYGMNFEYMPHLHWKLGPYLILGMIFMITAGMLYYFRKKHWI